MGAEKRTGGQLLVSCLKNLGVETSFGVPGGILSCCAGRAL